MDNNTSIAQTKHITKLFATFLKGRKVIVIKRPSKSPDFSLMDIFKEKLKKFMQANWITNLSE